MNMQQFEFLRNLTIGQYLPTGSFIHRLDPRVRLVSAVMLLLSITLAPHAIGLFLAFIILLFFFVLARIPLKYALKGLLPPLPFLGFIIILQILFFRSTTTIEPLFTWGFLTISKQNLTAAGVLFLRFVDLILGISLVTSVISSNEMVRGLQGLFQPLGRLGLPVHDLVLMTQITLRFLPLLAQTAERVAKAQAARGADWGGKRFQPIKNARRIVPVIVPIFLISLGKAERLALAMDSRAYDSFSRRTSMVEFHTGITEIMFLVLSIASAVLVFIL